MNLFFDTSAFVKYLVNEDGSDIVSELVEDTSNSLFALRLIKTETYSAIFRRAKNGEIEYDRLAELCQIIDNILKFWFIDTITDDVLNEAEILIRKFGVDPGLRTLDALHLAAFNLNAEHDWYFVCSDKRLVDIVKILGYHTIIPG